MVWPVEKPKQRYNRKCEIAYSRLAAARPKSREESERHWREYWQAITAAFPRIRRGIWQGATAEQAAVTFTFETVAESSRAARVRRIVDRLARARYAFHVSRESIPSWRIQ